MGTDINPDQLQDGQNDGEVELQSVEETIITKVRAYDPNGEVEEGTIEIQFAPESS